MSCEAPSRIERAKARIDGRPVILSMSGGKDSTAAALYLREQGIPFQAVFMDTGWEHESVYEYIDEVLEPLFGPIKRLSSSKYANGMVDMLKGKKVFPSRLMRFCTEQLKVKPFMEHLATLDDEVVNVVGIRAEESAARAKMPEWEDSRALDCDVWRPLIDWTFEDVAEIHRRHNLPPAALYFKGSERVGCWPCIFSRKSEVRQVAEVDPARIDLIAQLEDELTDSARERFRSDEVFREKTLANARDRVAYEAIARSVSWSEWKNRDGVPTLVRERHARAADAVTQADIDREVGRMLKRTFFHGKKGQGSMTINEVVEWANGAGQLSFGLPAQDVGCFRWGFCDTRKGES